MWEEKASYIYRELHLICVGAGMIWGRIRRPRLRTTEKSHKSKSPPVEDGKNSSNGRRNYTWSESHLEFNSNGALGARSDQDSYTLMRLG